MTPGLISFFYKHSSAYDPRNYVMQFGEYGLGRDTYIRNSYYGGRFTMKAGSNVLYCLKGTLFSNSSIFCDSSLKYNYTVVVNGSSVNQTEEAV